MRSPLRHAGTERLPGIRRNRHIVWWAFVSAAVGLCVPDAGWGQELRRTEIRKFELNGRQAHRGRVIAIDPKGTVRVNLGFSSGFLGDHFLATKLAGSLDEAILIRVELIESRLEEPGDVLMRVAPEALHHLKVGDTVWHLEPRAEGLPDTPPVIPLHRRTPDDPGYALTASLHTKRNLGRIGMALHEFHSANGHLPPAVIYGPDGRPWHSWRVLLLPFFRDPDRSDVDYDYSQPWDSERNRRVLAQTPAVYRDPMYGSVKGELTHYAEAKDDDTGQYTHYVAITGEGTAFPSVGRRMTDPMSLPLGGREAGVSRFDEMPDGHGNIILIGPVGPGRKIPWTKPEDLAFGPDFPAPGRPGGFGAPYKMKNEEGNAVGYAHLLLGDGMIRTFSETVDAARFRKLMTIGDGSKVDPISLAVNPERGHFYDLTLELTRDGGRWSARLDSVAGVRQGPNER